MEPERRPFALQWSLRTMLLLTAVVAVWVAHFHLRSENSRLAREVTSMTRLSPELVVEDERQIAAVLLPQLSSQGTRWDIYLPEGDYLLRLATRGIDEQGFAPLVDETSIRPGKHRLELLRYEEGESWRIAVTIDGRRSIDVEEELKWDTSDMANTDNPFVDCKQVPADEPVVLYRRRAAFQGTNLLALGPVNGILLWIERIEPADSAGGEP